jgi:hypothetical protein
LLWIDPLDYQADFACGVDILREAGVNVSVYNLPLCLLDSAVWDVAVQSISEWKNGYLPECDGCAARGRCAGFFLTGRPRLSRGTTDIGARPLKKLALRCDHNRTADMRRIAYGVGSNRTGANIVVVVH